MTKLFFSPYEDWVDDVRRLVNGQDSPATRQRLRGAIGPSPCGKTLHYRWDSLGRAIPWPEDTVTAPRFVCEQPAGHEGPHIPNVSDECWR